MKKSYIWEESNAGIVAKARANKTGYKNIYIFSSSVGSAMESWTNPTLLEFIYSKG